MDGRDRISQRDYPTLTSNRLSDSHGRCASARRTITVTTTLTSPLTCSPVPGGHRMPFPSTTAVASTEFNRPTGHPFSNLAPGPGCITHEPLTKPIVLPNTPGDMKILDDQSGSNWQHSTKLGGSQRKHNSDTRTNIIAGSRLRLTRPQTQSQNRERATPVQKKHFD